MGVNHLDTVCKEHDVIRKLRTVGKRIKLRQKKVFDRVTLLDVDLGERAASLAAAGMGLNTSSCDYLVLKKKCCCFWKNFLMQ